MSPTKPLSLVNKILFPLSTAVVALLLVSGQWPYAAIGAVALTDVGVVAQRARRGKGSTSDRINALQPYDERDTELLRTGLAWVGSAAQIMQLGMVLVAAAFWSATELLAEVARLLVLFLTVIVANGIAVRRADRVA